MTIVLLIASADVPTTDEGTTVSTGLRYAVGTGLEIPGLEAIMEIGQISDLSGGAVDVGLRADGVIPGVQRINDRSVLDQVRVSQIDGLYDDPDAQDLRTKLPDRHGERAGLMSYAGRTIGLTGSLVAGSINAMRDINMRLKAALPEVERSLLIHPPGEVPQYQNVCPDPLASGFPLGVPSTSAGGGTIAFTGGVVDGLLTTQETSWNATTAAGTHLVYANRPWIGVPGSLPAPFPLPWKGQDLWAHARVKVQSASTVVSSAQLVLIPYDAAGTAFNVSSGVLVIATQASPATGAWYSLSGAVPPTSLPPAGAGFTIGVRFVTAAAGSFTYRATRFALVPIPTNAAAPPGYFDGTFPGFEWDSAAPARSRGPSKAVNQVTDPLAHKTTNWTDASTGSPTVVGPTQMVAGSGLVDVNGQATSAVYYSATNPTASSRTLALAINAVAGARFVVAAGRTYQVGISLNVLQVPTGTVVSVVWLDQSGSVLSTAQVGAAVVAGVSRYATAVIAPPGAVAAYLRVAVTTSTSGAVLQVFASRAQFCDVSEHGVSIVGDESYAVLDGGRPNSGAIGPIRRPWLMRNVRKASYSCPELQSSLRPRRDFTLSLRAADPRLYAADEHNVQVQLTGSGGFVSVLPPSGDRNLDPTFDAPTSLGFTYDKSASGGSGTYFWVSSDIPLKAV